MVKVEAKEDPKCFRLRCKLCTITSGVNDYQKKVMPQKEFCSLLCLVPHSVLVTPEEVSNKVRRVSLQNTYEGVPGLHISRGQLIFTGPHMGQVLTGE